MTTGPGILQCVRIGAYTAADVPGLVPVHLEAFRNYANQRLGPGYTSAFLRYFCERTHNGVAIGGWAEGSPVGYVCGLEPEAETEMNRRLRWAALQALAVRPWLLLDPQIVKKVSERVRLAMRGAAVHPVLASICRPPIMGLISIGVAAAASGRGIGARLMEAFELECRERGMATMYLSVYTENARARRLYESIGWQRVTADGPSSRACYYAKSVGG